MAHAVHGHDPVLAGAGGHHLVHRLEMPLQGLGHPHIVLVAQADESLHVGPAHRLQEVGELEPVLADGHLPLHLEPVDTGLDRDVDVFVLHVSPEAQRAAFRPFDEALVAVVVGPGEHAEERLAGIELAVLPVLEFQVQLLL